MKRRTFIQSLGALFILPSLPARLSAMGLSTELYAKAEYYSGLWVHTSPTMMKNAFSIDQATAENLFNQLVKDNILSAPNHFGVAKAVTPYYEMPSHASRVHALLRGQGFERNILGQSLKDRGKNLSERLQKFLTKEADEMDILEPSPQDPAPDLDDPQMQQDLHEGPPRPQHQTSPDAE